MQATIKLPLNVTTQKLKIKFVNYLHFILIGHWGDTANRVWMQGRFVMWTLSRAFAGHPSLPFKFTNSRGSRLRECKSEHRHEKTTSKTNKYHNLNQEYMHFIDIYSKFIEAQDKFISSDGKYCYGKYNGLEQSKTIIYCFVNIFIMHYLSSL